jgi:hypothetical protein
MTSSSDLAYRKMCEDAIKYGQAGPELVARYFSNYKDDEARLVLETAARSSRSSTIASIATLRAGWPDERTYSLLEDIAKSDKKKSAAAAVAELRAGWPDERTRSLLKDIANPGKKCLESARESSREWLDEEDPNVSYGIQFRLLPNATCFMLYGLEVVFLLYSGWIYDLSLATPSAVMALLVYHSMLMLSLTEVSCIWRAGLISSLWVRELLMLPVATGDVLSSAFLIMLCLFVSVVLCTLEWQAALAIGNDHQSINLLWINASVRLRTLRRGLLCSHVALWLILFYPLSVSSVK